MTRNHRCNASLCMLVVPLVILLMALSAAPAVAQTVDDSILKSFSWRNIGPANMGGRTVDIEGIDSNPKIIYAGSATSGIWKTVNAGTTWEPIFDHMPIATIGDLAVSQSDPDIIFAGTGEANGRNSSPWGRGVYKSTDAGASWELVGLEETHAIGRVLIDPEDPDADREGPVSLKANMPIDVHNLYLYLVTNNVAAPDEIGVAAKAEFVFGPVETGVGAIYQKNVSPSGMLTLSGSLGDVDIFGEAVLRYGSDRRFLEESDTAPLGIEVAEHDESVFFNATAGFSYLYSFESYDSTLSLAGQYLFNGEGYSDPSLISDNQAGIGALLASGDLRAIDLSQTGQHYAAASAGWRTVFGSGFSIQAFWMHNFTDMSGRLVPTVSVELFDGLSLELSTPISYGESGDEMNPGGSSLSAQVSVSMGGGSF